MFRWVQDGRILGNRAGVGGGDDLRASVKIVSYLLQFGDRQTSVLRPGRFPSVGFAMATLTTSSAAPLARLWS